MADGTIRIGIELDDGGIKSEAKAAGASAGDAAGDGLEQGLDQGSKSGADKAGANIESFGDKMKGVLAGISVAALAASINELVSVTNEFQEDMGKLSVAAQQNNVATDAANGAYRDMVGILGETDQSVEAVNHLFALCGENTQALSDWTNIASGVYATFGDSLPLEGLTEAANETAKVGQVTGALADAINWASEAAVQQGVALSGNQAAIDAYNSALADGATQEDAFNAALAACNTEQERAQLITDTLNGVYAEAGEPERPHGCDVVVGASVHAHRDWAYERGDHAAVWRAACGAVVRDQPADNRADTRGNRDDDRVAGRRAQRIDDCDDCSDRGNERCGGSAGSPQRRNEREPDCANRGAHSWTRRRDNRAVEQ